MSNYKISGLQRYSKETPTQVFSCEYGEIFKSTYFEEHLRTAAISCTKYVMFNNVCLI